MTNDSLRESEAMEFDTSPWSHRHNYAADTSAAERGTRVVLWITLLAMVVEIIAGWAYNSMALLADGWHMSSHALAIGLSVLAYGAARRYADDPRFAFGPWKIEVLGGFASAVLLLGVAALMAFASIERLLDPQPIRYREALLVAAVGLGVNLVCAWNLVRSHTHGHAHGHGHENGHSHGPESATDLNLRSAYVHVLADAATSVLALIALAGGWWYGWQWLDPVMGIVGAVLVAIWARRLIIDTSRVLLDREMDHPVVEEIREVIELPIKHPELFTALGIAQPKGVLLYGPPGTGKTLLAKATATHICANFVMIKCPELLAGDGDRRIQEKFAQARALQPCVVYLEEFEAIASSGDAASIIVSQVRAG